MWGAQQLSMQLIMVDTSLRSTSLIANVAVPIKPGSILRSINFSAEGMLLSQDVSGTLRAFSLERGDWTTVSIEGLEDTRKVWVIGASNYQLIYWRTTAADPEPTVAPRFTVEHSAFYIPTLGLYPENTQATYERLLWSRFVLDHEKARARLWGRLKVSRSQSSPYYLAISSIMGEQEIAVRHEELDEKFYALIQLYLKGEESLRALYMAKTCLRSLEATRKLIELFDYYNKRSLAIQMEEFCEEKQREIDYEQMQVFEFIKMRESIPSFSQSVTLAPRR
jgi:hypothetical protein